MAPQKFVVPFATAAFPRIRGAVAHSALLAGAILALACSGRTELEDARAATGTDSDSATPSGDGADSAVDCHDGGLFRPCIGHNDFSRGSCAEGEICGYMPYVTYSYCMPSVPCPAGMVPVLDFACAYPCDAASACIDHGLARCAVNTYRNIGGGPAGWCTP